MEHLNKNKRISDKLCRWILSKLSHDNMLEFHIMFGLSDFNGHSPEEAIWSIPSMSLLSRFRDRIKIHGELGWDEVLNLMSKTKLCIAFPLRYGGPPLEASMFGIPMIGQPDISPFIELPEYIGVNYDNDRFMTEIERLYSDHSYYRIKGDAYRNYSNNNYTYSAFLKNLNILTLERFKLSLEELLTD
jgi:hypothetical protein